MRLTAFAETIQFWKSEEAYADANPEAKRQGTRWIVPTGVYPADKGGTDRATASVVGHVLEATEHINTLTGGAFHHLRLETTGAILDVVTAAGPLPAPGDIARGHFWLAAVVEPTEPGSLLRLAL